MSLQNGKLSNDLLHSHAHIWNHIFSFINSMSLKCAVQLQIPDIIARHGKPMLLSELVQAIGVKKERSRFVFRLMRILVHSGFFMKETRGNDDEDEEAGEGYLLAPASRLLLTEEPLSIRPFLLSTLDPVLVDPWHYMSKWLKNDDDVNPFHTAHGIYVFEFAGQEPGFNQELNEGMASDARLVISVILKHCRDVFHGLNSIVDVGGGTGTVAKAIAKDFPNINCISFDLPHVVNGLVGSKNVLYVGGDMFEEDIPKADAVLMKWILHDWNDEECIELLKKCKKTIPSKENGGKLIIIEIVVNVNEGDRETLINQLFMDMDMMALATGKERTEKEWAKLFDDAGFSGYKITPVLAGLRSLIQVYP